MAESSAVVSGTTISPTDLNNGMGVLREGNSVFIIPHTRTYSAMFNQFSKTYKFGFDEALNKGIDAAKFMRNDAFIMGLYRSRIMPVAKSDYKVEASGNAASDEIGKWYQDLLECTPLWHDYRRSVMECAWYGRHAIQMAHDWNTHEGRPIIVEGEPAIGISDWVPHMGDKITFTFDRKPCIRVNPFYSGSWEAKGLKVLPPEDPRIVQEGARVRWTEVGPVVVLDTPEIRQKFAISVFEVQDTPWDEPSMAGGIRGIGLRHYAFWHYDTRQEIVAWAMQHLEDFGAGGYTIVGYDGPEGLTKAKAAFEKPGQRIIYAPIVPGMGERITDQVTRLTPTGTGNDAIQCWAQDYFDAALAVLFVGHPLNVKSASTGLNSDQGQKAQELKQVIHKADAEILDAVMTHEVLPLLKQYNHPNEKFTLRFRSSIRAATKEQAIAATKAHFDMGGQVPLKHLHAITEVPEVDEEEDDYLSKEKEAEKSHERSLEASKAKGKPEPYTASQDSKLDEYGASELLRLGTEIGSIAPALRDRVLNRVDSMTRMKAIAKGVTDPSLQVVAYTAIQEAEAQGLHVTPPQAYFMARAVALLGEASADTARKMVMVAQDQDDGKKLATSGPVAFSRVSEYLDAHVNGHLEEKDRQHVKSLLTENVSAC